MANANLAVDDIVHVHATDEFLSDVEADGLADYGNKHIDAYMEKMSNRDLKWKITSIETHKDGQFANLEPIGFECEPGCMFELELLVRATESSAVQ